MAQMPIAVLNRALLQSLAEERLREAKLLLDAGLFTGAYYLTGLGIECALKACIARSVKEYDFPDKEYINAIYTHSLEKNF